jgi:glutathione S-transferase
LPLLRSIPSVSHARLAIEVELKKCAGKFCVGDEVSVADVCLAPQIYNARRFGVDLSKVRRRRAPASYICLR